MADLSRVTISLEDGLLQSFDQFIANRSYANRSEAIRDLIRDRLIAESAQDEKKEIVAVVTIVFDHHARELAAKLIDKQHSHHNIVISSMHVHLGTRHCLEVSILRGPGKLVQTLADEIIGTRGVLHGHVNYTSGEDTFAQWTDADHADSHSHGGHSHSHGHKS
jgi:CopG family transcriptional regulator, nickel-responsive regulator